MRQRSWQKQKPSKNEDTLVRFCEFVQREALADRSVAQALQQVKWNPWAPTIAGLGGCGAASVQHDGRGPVSQHGYGTHAASVRR